MPHIHKDIDFTTSVFIVNAKRVLLHVHGKYKVWLPPGGHIELTEDPNEAALREVREECGLEVTFLEPRGTRPPDIKEWNFKHLVAPFYFNIHEVGKDAPHRHSDFIYFATSASDAVMPEHPGDEWRWLTENDLASGTWELLPSVRFCAQEALKAALMG